MLSHRSDVMAEPQAVNLLFDKSMKGTRPLDNNEIRLVSACFIRHVFEVRNRGLIHAGCEYWRTISRELLSLRRSLDVYQNRYRAVTDLLFDKSIVKGGEISESRAGERQTARVHIEDLIGWHRETIRKFLDVKRPVVSIAQRNRAKNGCRERTAHDVSKLKDAFDHSWTQR